MIRKEEVQTDQTLPQPQGGVKVDIKDRAGSIVLSGNLKTGKKNAPGSHDINLRNFVRQEIRVCFGSRDQRPISQYFVSNIDEYPGDEKVGWVKIDAALSGGPQEYNLELSDEAWLTDGSGVPLPGSLGLSANLFSQSGPCSFSHYDPDDDHHGGDIIIDGGN